MRRCGLKEAKMLTDAQVRLIRRKMKEGKTQEAAAAAASVSVRTARKWQDGPLPSQAKEPRSWRTRKDPFDGLWENEVVPLLELDTKGKLEAKTILEELRLAHADKISFGHLRTLQRRVREWRAMHGGEKEVYFEQAHPPGREAALDFTDARELRITIEGQPLRHLLFELVLVHSSWTWLCVAFGETFEALIDGLQRALWALGGVPEVLRTDNLSAATHELRRGGGRGLTKRFADVCDHLGIARVTRINPGKSHENGAIEQRHFRTKKQLEQALILRGNRDFTSVEVYEQWAREVVDNQHNRHIEDKLRQEQLVLRPLPARAVPATTVFHSKVRKWSTVTIGHRRYSVPSRLIGHTVELQVHPNTVELRYGDKLVDVFPRLRGQRTVRVDYRHIIGSLVKKPGAFAQYRFREELFPSMTFRLAYDALVSLHGERADIEYVRILDLAATTMECTVEQALKELLSCSTHLDYRAVQALASPPNSEHPMITIKEPDLAVYDELLGGGA